MPGCVFACRPVALSCCQRCREAKGAPAVGRVANRWRHLELFGTFLRLPNAPGPGISIRIALGRRSARRDLWLAVRTAGGPGAERPPEAPPAAFGFLGLLLLGPIEA